MLNLQIYPSKFYYLGFHKFRPLTSRRRHSLVVSIALHQPSFLSSATAVQTLPSSAFVICLTAIAQMEKLVVDQPDPTSATLDPPVSLEVDLSASLAASTKVVELPAATTEKPRKLTKRWKLAPTRKEQDKWDRATKAATRGSDVMFRELRKPRGDPKVLAAQAREQYYKLKNKLQTLTLGVGGVGLVSAYVS